MRTRRKEAKEEGGREGELMDNSGGRGVFLRNWDRDPVGERSRARRLEEGRKEEEKADEKISEKLLQHIKTANNPI